MRREQAITEGAEADELPAERADLPGGPYPIADLVPIVGAQLAEARAAAEAAGPALPEAV